MSLSDIQGSKYDVFKGKIVKRRDRTPIPDDEPVFILRASDRNTVHALFKYANQCQDNDHRNTVIDRIHAFTLFAEEHPERMKEPDSEKYE